jgi:predicted N-acetyltransferase YhbS
MSASLAPLSSIRIAPETSAEAAEAEALVLDAFGPGRFAKTAERLREAARRVAGFTARQDGRMVGSVRLWAITVGGADALFLGPIAVASQARREGLGANLVAACVEDARCRGVAGVLLVGDASYFSRFGFVVAPRAVLPGPADPQRVLWLGIGNDLAEGLVLPA